MACDSALYHELLQQLRAVDGENRGKCHAADVQTVLQRHGLRFGDARADLLMEKCDIDTTPLRLDTARLRGAKAVTAATERAVTITLNMIASAGGRRGRHKNCWSKSTRRR